MKKLLIANRGEIACRIIRSAAALGVETIAIYSEVDADALHVSKASAAHPVGPAKASESYLHGGNLLAAATASGADALHPGYGFLAENAAFARQVMDAGLTWVGPRPEQIEAMGDKDRARRLARAAGLPVVPGSDRLAMDELDTIESAAKTVGFPLLVKASAGGGGIGMRLVESPAELEKTARATQALAARAFGDGTIFLERYIPKARHIEIQIFGFGDGRAVHFFARECSIQRRFQKIVEEAPVPDIPAEVRNSIANAAVALAQSQNYLGAGTVEFILDANSYEFFFLEMNTRIQVEHPVTEFITGHDLVALQLRLARGDDLAELRQKTIRARGHAIECRLYAENPEKKFLPSPGTLEVLEFPNATDTVRIDTGVRQGDVVTPYYDPMIAKLVCWGENREEARTNMHRLLAQVCVAGIDSNIAFLRRVIAHPGFRDGDVFTGFVDQHLAELIA